MAKYNVTVGVPFAIDALEIEEIEAVERLAAINERRLTAKHQARITYVVLAFTMLAIVTTAIVGWYDGSYDELKLNGALSGPSKCSLIASCRPLSA